VPELKGYTLLGCLGHENPEVIAATRRFMNDSERYHRYMEEEGHDLGKALRRYMIEQKIEELRQPDMVFTEPDIVSRSTSPTVIKRSDGHRVVRVGGKVVIFGEVRVHSRTSQKQASPREKTLRAR